MRWYHAQKKKAEEHRAAEKAAKEAGKARKAKRNKPARNEESQTANTNHAKKAKHNKTKPVQAQSKLKAPRFFENWTTTDSGHYLKVSVSVPDTYTCHSLAYVYGKYTPGTVRFGEKHGRDPKYPDSELGSKSYAQWPTHIQDRIRRHEKKQKKAGKEGKVYSSPYAPSSDVDVKVLVAPELPAHLLAVRKK